jgi:hypothetical protein
MDEKRYPYFGVPPARQPRSAADEPALRGKRVILSTPEGFVYDMRAVSAVHIDPAGASTVDIATEEDYYRWMLLQVPPKPTSYPIHLVWVE